MKIQLAKREGALAQRWAEEHELFSCWKTGVLNSGYPDDRARFHALIDSVTPDNAEGDSPALIWWSQTSALQFLFLNCH